MAFVEKKHSSLRTITENILTKIGFIKGYEEYDLGNDRYPKKICKIYYFPVHERFSNPFTTEFNYKLPDISNFSEYLYYIWQHEQAQLAIINTIIVFFMSKINLENLKLNTKGLILHKFALNISKRQVEGFDINAWHQQHSPLKALSMQ